MNYQVRPFLPFTICNFIFYYVYLFIFSQSLFTKGYFLSRKVRIIRIKIKLFSLVNKLRLNNCGLKNCPKFIPSSIFHFSLRKLELLKEIKEICCSVWYLFFKILLKWLKHGQRHSKMHYFTCHKAYQKCIITVSKNDFKGHFYPQSLVPCDSIKGIRKCCPDLRFLLLLTTIVIVQDKRLSEGFFG